MIKLIQNFISRGTQRERGNAESKPNKSFFFIFPASSISLRHCVRFSFIIFLVISTLNLHAQQDDSYAAQRYVQWIQRAIDEKRISDAIEALERARDFAGVSSDIPYLYALVQSGLFGTDRIVIIESLNTAIETNRWNSYNENHALLLKAQHQIAMRDYDKAIDSLVLIPAFEASGNMQLRADTVMLYLLALRGLSGIKDSVYDPVQSTVHFRSQVLQAMDRFPRDPRVLRIYFGYIKNSNRPEVSDLPFADINLLELAFRRLPFLLEIDPELAWMAAPYMRDIDEARRLVASYRSGGISDVRNRDFMPHPGSIPVALNLGLIDDMQAIEELFSGKRSYNNPLPLEIANSVSEPDGNPVLDKDIIVDVYRLLRSEEGRELFTQRLLGFTGTIFFDENNDGYYESAAIYNSGTIERFILFHNQRNIVELVMLFSDGKPEVCEFTVSFGNKKNVYWERYPFVKEVTYSNLSGIYESFKFAPADFSYAPVSFIDLGGSNRLTGLLYPVPAFQYIELSRFALLSSCTSLSRLSREIDGAAETIYLNKGIIIQVVETLNGQQVSVTEFERGLPVVQHIDLDLDGRMETIRRFRRPPADYVWEDLLDYRRLIASSESDWSGDGRNKTMEVYLQDGSVVYYFDMDGSGTWTHYDIGNQQ